MSGEGLLVWGALRAGGIVLVPASALAWVLRGPSGALAAASALALVLANLAVAGAVLVLAARRSPTLFPAVAIPSYVFRMAGMFAAMSALLDRPLIDPSSFAVTFGAGVAGLLAYEWMIWARTPWIALSLKEPA